MVPHNRSDNVEIDIIAALLTDIQMSHDAVFSVTDRKHTFSKVCKRVSAEGIGFLTKTLPRLGKAFDKALCEATVLNATALGFEAQRNSKLPRFLGEFFNLVLAPDGTVLPDPCATSVRVIRDVLYLFYKYKLPYSPQQEQQVLDSFIKTEQDLVDLSAHLIHLGQLADSSPHAIDSWRLKARDPVTVTLRARDLLSRALQGFDPTDIIPSHGPGAVATKQRLWGKYDWSNVSDSINNYFPLDAYFHASLGHVCDALPNLSKIRGMSLPAKVILVPKDSRGPRLISCEPVDNQWIQQGIMRRLVQHVESCPVTNEAVHFTDQSPNQCGALLGSCTGRYATLDLKEASDRVSTDLVRLLFPSHLVEVFESCRSLGTELPGGRILPLKKFAPMGSALCFPVMALTIFSILAASAPDAYTRDRILVYGDDVIFPTAFAVNAIEQLESFGLKINHDKCCIKGSFRESCGVDAFKGVSVTPLRLRTVWSSRPSAENYTSWISYANSMYDRKYFTCYEFIVGKLHQIYGAIPDDGMTLSCPSLREVLPGNRPNATRIHRGFQKKQWRVRDIKSPTVRHEMDGWSMLLRFFTESGSQEPSVPARDCRVDGDWRSYKGEQAPFSVRSYTKRKTSMLVYRWR